jgi:hypothetical protein
MKFANDLERRNHIYKFLTRSKTISLEAANFTCKTIFSVSNFDLVHHRVGSCKGKSLEIPLKRWQYDGFYYFDSKLRFSQL